jgi:hypothetical protein
VTPLRLVCFSVYDKHFINALIKSRVPLICFFAFSSGFLVLRLPNHGNQRWKAVKNIVADDVLTQRKSEERQINKNPAETG